MDKKIEEKKIKIIHINKIIFLTDLFNIKVANLPLPVALCQADDID